jgi:hypothetical protein
MCARDHSPDASSRRPPPGTFAGSSPEFGILFMILTRQFYGLPSLSSFSSNPIEVSGLEPWKRLQKLA